MDLNVGHECGEAVGKRLTVLSDTCFPVPNDSLGQPVGRRYLRTLRRLVSQISSQPAAKDLQTCSRISAMYATLVLKLGIVSNCDI